MPSLSTVTLSKNYAFYYKKNIHTKSSPSSSPSFLDITPALQHYLQFIVSFTRHSHPNTKSPFSFHTTITPFLPQYHSFYSYRYITRHAVKHSFIQILSFHSNSGDQPKLSFCYKEPGIILQYNQYWLCLITEHAVASLLSLSLVDSSIVMDTSW